MTNKVIPITFLSKDESVIYRGASNIEIKILEFDDKQITYRVNNVPLHTFDQHARARVGIKFFDLVYSKKTYSLYTEIFDKLYNDSNMLNRFFAVIDDLENASSDSEFKDDYNLMSKNCSYTVTQDYGSLRGQMMRRLKLCEEEQIVALHWMLREKMINEGIEVAKSFLPGCDITGECDYIAVSDHLSNAFGALFDACGRWPYDTTVYRSFNKSCTTPELLKEQCNIDIARSKYEIENKIR